MQTLLFSGISCGTTVILKGGDYYVGDLTLMLQNNCTEETPIVFIAAPNETPVLTGGDTTQYIWIKTPGDSTIYSTVVHSGIAYTSLCLLNDSVRLYPYGLLVPAAFPYPSLTDLGYGLSGFYRRDSSFYFKTLDSLNPNNQHLTFSSKSRCMIIDGNNKNNYLYLKGVTFRYYAKPIITKNTLSLVDGDYPATALTFKNTNHIIIDNCHFEYCNWTVNFSDSCSHTLVQNCTFKDGVGKYSHGAFKQTRDAIVIDQGSYGRYMEYAALNFGSQAHNTIIRNNTVEGYIGGLVGKSLAPDVYSQETDIYNNLVSNCYNGINTDGGSINTRIWNNTVDHCSVGLSFINASFGPNYIFRNIIHHILERKNHNDIFFLDCDNRTSVKIWGTGVKLNASPRTNNPSDMIFVHNTFHSADTIGFDMYLWNSTWKSIYSRNNIYYSKGMSSFFLDGINDDTAYNFNSRNDCYYNNKNTIAIIQPTNGIPECKRYPNIATFNEGLRNITKDTRCTVSNGLTIDPLFKSIPLNNYSLSPTSALIDKGEIIPGFNDDYSGSFPDIGATENPPIVSVKEENGNNADRFSVCPNPSNSIIFIRYFAKFNQEQFDIYSLLGEKKTSVIGGDGWNEIKAPIDNLTSGVYYIRRISTGEIMPILILNN
ncbi:MAG: right-handed parallel beta-helix repeat-containing protein [Ignavibacteriae bacterium]|nr:right-handed parallel beta-helix repeat-containing protein [Ignavibacteriota bacterium]